MELYTDVRRGHLEQRKGEDSKHWKCGVSLQEVTEWIEKVSNNEILT